MKALPHSFFEEKTLKVAKNLVGKILARRAGGKVIREMITETEAYVGPHDLACHSARGKTARNEVMFREAGTIYVYFTYGMHWMLNIVTEEKNFPAAVLIRGTTNLKGPARLTKALKIDKSLNGKKLGRKSGLWIASPRRSHVAEALAYGASLGEGGKTKLKIVRTPRIGVAYAGEWAKKPYRFLLKPEK